MTRMGGSFVNIIFTLLFWDIIYQTQGFNAWTSYKNNIFISVSIFNRGVRRFGLYSETWHFFPKLCLRRTILVPEMGRRRLDRKRRRWHFTGDLLSFCLKQWVSHSHSNDSFSKFLPFFLCLKVMRTFDKEGSDIFGKENENEGSHDPFFSFLSVTSV